MKAAPDRPPDARSVCQTAPFGLSVPRRPNAKHAEDHLPRERCSSLDESSNPVRVAASPRELRPVESGPDREGPAPRVAGDRAVGRLNFWLANDLHKRVGKPNCANQSDYFRPYWTPRS